MLFFSCHLKLLAKENDLELIVAGEHTSASDGTKNVGARTLEERLGTFLGDDLLEGGQGRVVLDGGTRGHHHASADGVDRVGCCVYGELHVRLYF